MKKLFILVAFFMMVLPVMSVFAEDSDSNLVLRKTPSFHQSYPVLNPGYLVDGNELTSTSVPKNGFLYFSLTRELGDTFDISSLTVSSKSTVPSAITVKMYNKSGAVVYNAALSSYNTKIPLNAKGVVDVWFYISSSVSVDPVISEITIMGTRIPAGTNTDANKFVINNLKYTSISDTAITLNWTPISSVYLKSYKVYQNNVLKETIATNSYPITSLEPGETYSFKVTPVDTFNKEFPGATISYTVPVPDTTPPEKVQGVRVQPSKTSALVTWTKSSADDLAGYWIYVDGQKANESLLISESYQLTGLKEKTTYKVHVVAQDKAGNVSENSDEARFQTDTTPPDQIKGVKVQPSQTEALITWTKSSADDLAGYSVYVDGQKVTDLLTSESYKLTGLKTNTTYKVYVVAQDKAGNVSDKSDTVSFTTTIPTTDSDQEQTPEYILVTWTATPGAISYEVLLNGRVVGTAPADATSFKVTKAMGYNPQNLTNKTAVRAKFADGSTGGSNPGGGNPFGGGWGFDGKDVWQNVVMLVGSLSIFLLLGIVIKFAPRIFTMIRNAINAKKSY